MNTMPRVEFKKELKAGGNIVGKALALHMVDLDSILVQDIYDPLSTARVTGSQSTGQK